MAEETAGAISVDKLFSIKAITERSFQLFGGLNLRTQMINHIFRSNAPSEIDEWELTDEIDSSIWPKIDPIIHRPQDYIQVMVGFDWSQKEE